MARAAPSTSRCRLARSGTASRQRRTLRRHAPHESPMITNGRILLLDVLDATGSDIGDARDRAALLRAAGARVTALAIGHHLDAEARGLGRDSLISEPGAPALRAGRLLATSARIDHAIVA